MRFTIKEDQNLNTDVIREEFLEKYYPEMGTKRMHFVSVFSPITNYVRLQKNLAVAAYFRVKQDPKKGTTHINVSEGVTKRSAILGADFWNFLIRGDFYDDLNRKFNGWLMKKYNVTKEQITLTNPWSRTALFINSLLWAALIVAVLLFIFDQINQSVNLVIGHDFTPWQEFLYNLPTGRRASDMPIILIMFAAFFSIIYYFKKRRKDERDAKMEYFTGMKIQPYQPRISKKNVSVIFLNLAVPLTFIFGILAYSDAIIFLFLGLFAIAIIVDFLLILIWLFKFKKKNATIIAYINIAFLICAAGAAVLFGILVNLTRTDALLGNVYMTLFIISLILFIIAILLDLIYYIMWRNGKISTAEQKTLSDNEDATIMN